MKAQFRKVCKHHHQLSEPHISNGEPKAPRQWPADLIPLVRPSTPKAKFGRNVYQHKYMREWRERKTSGSVLVEFALALPVLVSIIIGGMDLGFAMLNMMQLVFVTQQAAVVQAAKGTGIAWGTAQLSTATFSVASANCITGTLPYQPIFLPASWFPPLTDTACAASPQNNGSPLG
jgi:hypothetical protein